MNRYIRCLISFVTAAIVIPYGISLRQTLLDWSGLVFIMLIYSLLIWEPQSWWTRLRYVLSVCLLIVLTLLFSYFNNRNVYTCCLLIPLILLLAKEQQKNYRRFSTLLAAITMLAMCVVLPDYTFVLTVMPGIITAYFCVRAINLYKDAYRLSQLHIQELSEAHRELRQTHEALQEASVHSMRYVALAERTHLAREMHDGLGHQLTSLVVQLQALEIMLPSDPQQAATTVPVMLGVARHVMAELRQAVREWREDETKLGLVALQGLISQCATSSLLTIDFNKSADLSEWSIEMSVAIYRIVQEALTNIMRHAQATAASVQVQEHHYQVILTIADNGTYTEETPLIPGFGIKGIMERSNALGGSYLIEQNSLHGLRLQVTLPTIQPEQENNAGKQEYPHTSLPVSSASLPSGSELL